ncbi:MULTISPECIES: hypothetical protein [unclassified Gilliamella]|uniref:hypothetical protein n=1 Tax=unclassified Gilliamella TaxID=2685620 RepID=UPI00226A57DC|nr:MULTISPECIES: hypothetical protein [unclassified Gilliamella]MCX8586690.1 hypothetical protein [Gilliamella sp. B3562]MCX8686291.1 hypothetical protein [Gilliamella sp. B2864]
MLGFLKKLLSGNKEKNAPVLSERDLNGRNRVGYPTMQLSREIDNLVKLKYRPLKRVIKVYRDTLFFKWGPAVINNTLSDEQLANLSGRNVQMVYLLLFRDMLRHISGLAKFRHFAEDWPEQFANELLDNCKMLGDSDDVDVAKKEALFANTELYNVDNPIDPKHPENTQIPDWTAPLAELIMLPPDMIYKCHRPLMAAIDRRKKR